MRHTEYSLLNTLGEYYKQTGKKPTRKDVFRVCGVTAKPFILRFGSWKKAVDRFMQLTCGVDGEIALAVKPAAKPGKKDQLLQELAQQISQPELEAIVRSTRRAVTQQAEPFKVPVTGHFKFLATGDSHMGSNCFVPDWWKYMVDRAFEEGCQFAYHTGDILEGMSGRPGHVFELSEVGFEAQFGAAVEQFNYSPIPFRGITGNHDLWYAGKGDMGINVGQRLAAELKGQFTFLGNEEADDTVSGITTKLWHGRDGASYATSYRTQKFIEQLTGGEKPHILLAGHAHKSIFYECRNVMVAETGTTSRQTGFMRGKKLAAHTGFWIMEVWSNENGLARIKAEWNPLW